MSSALRGWTVRFCGLDVLRDTAERAGGLREWMLVDLATATGLPVGELADLRVGDVDFRRKLLRVRRLNHTPRAVDWIPIGRSLINHLFEFVKWKFRRGESIEPDAPLFRSKHGSTTVRESRHSGGLYLAAARRPEPVG